MVHRERTRMRQRHCGTDGEREQGRGGQKIASLLVPSQLCFLTVVTSQEMLKAECKAYTILTITAL